jgi:hypothetical protein
MRCPRAQRSVGWGAKRRKQWDVEKPPWAARWEMVFPQGASGHPGLSDSPGAAVRGGLCRPRIALLPAQDWGAWG